MSPEDNADDEYIALLRQARVQRQQHEWQHLEAELADGQISPRGRDIPPLMTKPQILIGMNARLFPQNWRPVREEITFAHQHGFQAIQLPGPEQGLDAERLGNALADVACWLQEAGLQAVMEMAVTVDVRGRTAHNCTPLDVLRANLPAITTLNINPVHWHLVLPRTTSPAEIAEFEINIRETLAEGVAIAQQHDFQFGLEHNGTDIPPFNRPESCRQVIAAVPGLGFVWDFNHFVADELDVYQPLVPRMQMLHISDAPAGETNHHLPLGQGDIDAAAYCRALHKGGFSGPAILEIGGTKKSGGFGKDTDEALLDSARRLRLIWETVT